MLHSAAQPTTALQKNGYTLKQIYKNRPPGTFSMMTLRQIRHFIAVAETGSISAAAQTAFISQSTLTLAIQQLEQEIGVGLFNRHAKGMTLTHQGHQFLRQAHLILATVDNAKRSLQQSTDQVAGQLIIGVTSLVAGYYLADLLTRFQRAYPNVEIRVMEDERPYIEHLPVSYTHLTLPTICSV